MTSQGAWPSPDGDELRARHHLRRLGHQEPPMPAPHDRRPVTPPGQTTTDTIRRTRDRIEGKAS